MICPSARRYILVWSFQLKMMRVDYFASILYMWREPALNGAIINVTSDLIDSFAVKKKREIIRNKLLFSFDLRAHSSLIIRRLFLFCVLSSIFRQFILSFYFFYRPLFPFRSFSAQVISAGWIKSSSYPPRPFIYKSKKEPTPLIYAGGYYWTSDLISRLHVRSKWTMAAASTLYIVDCREWQIGNNQYQTMYKPK